MQAGEDREEVESQGSSSAVAKALASVGGDKAKALKLVKEKLLAQQTELFVGRLKSRQKNEFLLDLIDVSSKLVDRSISEAVPLLALFQSLRLLAVDKEKIIRSQAFRALRKVITNSECVQMIKKVKLDIFISRALEREQRYLWERMQALKLCRQIMEVAPEFVPRSVVMSLVSIAEFTEDDFRKVCLDTLKELALINTEVLASCNAVKTIIDAILDPKCEEMAGSLTLTLLYLMDQESTRKHIRPMLELQKLLCVFTDTDAPDSPEKESKKKCATDALVMMMRSWTGILVLSSDEYGLKSIIKLMSLPDKVKGAVWSRTAVIDLLFEILEVVKVPGFSGFGIRGGAKSNLLNNYIVMVLIAFVNCGLVEVLTDIGINGSREAASLATSLLSAVLNLSADLLPPAQNAKLNALPSVVNCASKFDGEINQRIRASNILGDLSEHSDHLSVMNADPAGIPLGHQKMRLKTDQDSKAGEGDNDFNLNRGPYSLESIASQTDFNSNYRRYRRFTKESRKQYMVKSLRVQVESKMEDTELNNALRDSQVILHKQYRKWDFNICLELLEGPLMNTQVLSSVMNKTKFIKRLLSFIKPCKKFFSTLEWTVENSKYTAVACQLFKVLTSSEEASNYFFFVELIDEIFMTLVSKVTKKPLNPELSYDTQHLTPDSVSTTLSFEYFTLIGILSESKYGLKYLEKWNFIDDLYALASDPSMDYLTRLICTNLDYGGHAFEESKARQLLTYYLLNGSKTNRIYLLEHIRLMMRANVEGFQEWGLELLVTALSSNDKDVALASLAILEELCEQRENLDAFIKKNPSFTVVGEHANGLLTKFLSVPEGFEYLDEMNWIQGQFQHWRDEGMIHYVEELENALVSALNDNVSTAKFGGLSARTVEEEYFFDRLHSLPWRMELSISRGQSEFKLSLDAFVETRTSQNGGLQLFVVGEPRNDKTARFNRIDQSTSISASLIIGKEDKVSLILKDKWTKKSLPKSRQNLSKENPSISEDGVTWEFEFCALNPDDDDDDDDNPTTQEKVKVKRISFTLPFASSTYTIVSLAPHFFGEICKTPQGVEMFLRKSYIDEFVNMICDSNASWIERRAALWSIGQIGSSETGFKILQKTNIVQYISDQAMNCSTLSMRGTCFYILGLLSMTAPGRETLDKLGWDFPLNTDLAIAVPKDIVSFLKIPPVKYVGPWALNSSNKFGVASVPSTTVKTSSKLTVENSALIILGHISNLGNNVTQKASHAALQKMRQRYANYFQSGALMSQAANLLSSYTFHLPARRFVWFDLFDNVDLSESGITSFDE